MTAPREPPTESPMSATLLRTQNGSGFTTCRAHLDGLSQSCIVGGLDQSRLFGVEGAYLYHRPRIRFKVVKVSNDLVASRIGYPASLIGRACRTRVVCRCHDIDDTAFGKRIGDEVLRTVADKRT